MRLTTPRLILRDIEPKDAKSLIRNINNLNITKWLLVVPYPYTMKDAKWYINHCKEKRKKSPRESYSFNIQIKGQQGVVGGIGFHKVDRKQKTAEVGYWLSQDYWRQGYMREAANRLLDYGFNTLRLKTITIGAFARNVPSNSLAQRLGGKYDHRKGPVECKATGKRHMENVYVVTPASWRRSLRK